MLIEVLQDLRPFMMILVLFILAFASSHAIIQKETSFKESMASLLDEWLLIFGEYGDGDDYKAEYTIKDNDGKKE